MKKIIMILLLWSYAVPAMIPEITERTIEINKDSLLKYSKDFDTFLITKRDQKKQLSQLVPDSTSFFGSLITSFIENIIAPLFTTYGNVNVEEAKLFLGRSFEQEKLLKEAIKNLPNNEITIAYLDEIFSHAEGEILNKKDGPRFLEIVKKTKYKKVENPKCMGEKDPHGNYVICDTDFYNFSAATFMAFHIFENHVTLAPPLKRNRKIHTKA